MFFNFFFTSFAAKNYSFFLQLFCYKTTFYIYSIFILLFIFLDDVIPYTGDIMGRGTYVIRKGRKQRQKLCDIDSTSSINSRLSNEGNFLLPSPVFPISMMLPNSRHSIDLGSPPPPPPPVQNSLNSPR